MSLYFNQPLPLITQYKFPKVSFTSKTFCTALDILQEVLLGRAVGIMIPMITLVALVALNPLVDMLELGGCLAALALGVIVKELVSYYLLCLISLKSSVSIVNCLLTATCG